MKKIRSLTELIEEAKWGKLTKEELAYVVQRIEKTDPNGDRKEGWDLSGYLTILGLSGTDRYRKLVEKFLHYHSNEQVCASALRTLCIYWDLTKEYLDDVKLYIRGAEWDETDDVRIKALTIAGMYLREEFDKELLQLVLDVFENLGKSDQIKDTYEDSRYLIQSWAYHALALAMGVDPFEINDNETEKAILEGNLNAIDLSVIQKARQIVQKTS